MSIIMRDEVYVQDRNAIEEIIQATNMFADEEIKVAIELIDAYLREGESSGYLFLFAESDHKVIGYACYGKVPGTISSYHLYWIAVHPDFQSKKIGRRLLEQVERNTVKAEGDRIYIETAGKTIYDKTRKFYENSGYKKEAILKDFYAPADDKIIYVKKL